MFRIILAFFAGVFLATTIILAAQYEMYQPDPIYQIGDNSDYKVFNDGSWELRKPNGTMIKGCDLGESCNR